MKKIIFSMLVSLFTLGANAGNVVEPEYNGQVAIVNADSTTTLMPTEDADVKAKSNNLAFVPVAGMFLAKGQSYLAVKGREGLTKLPTRDVTFIVRVDNHNDNPNHLLGIIKFETKKKERRWMMAESALFGGTNVKTYIGDIKFQAKKYGESSFLLTVKGLEPGEYAVITKEINHPSTFSVK